VSLVNKRRMASLIESDIGYGQVKWVSEYLVREAGRRGLRGAIVRYISLNPTNLSLSPIEA